MARHNFRRSISPCATAWDWTDSPLGENYPQSQAVGLAKADRTATLPGVTTAPPSMATPFNSKQRHTPRTFFTFIFALLSIVCCAPAVAQFGVDDLVPMEEDGQGDEPAPEAKTAPSDALAVRQQEISDKFRHLEEVLLRMAELSAGVDPRRAALLRKAVAQSKQRLINVQFEKLVALLEKGQLSLAIENQNTVDHDLKALLELLLSEDRGRRIESEKARIREYLKRLNEIIKQQKGIQGRTSGGAETKRLADEQEKLADKTGGLSDDIKQNEEGGDQARGEDSPQGKDAEGKQDETPGAKPSEKKDGEAGGEQKAKSKEKEGAGSQSKPAEKSEGKSGSKDPAEKSQSPSTPSGDPQQGEKPSGENNGEKSQDSPQSQGRPQQGQSPGEKQAESSPGEQENPARKRLDAARQRMREAEEKLEEAEREGAVEKQEEAIRELEQAKADLEEILRQLREEEIGRMLALLETRFRKMLQMQREVYDGTVRLDKVPEADRAHSHDIEAGRLSGREADIVLEADKALTLMREDGTAVAFPEAVEQMREDMEQVVQRLAQSRVDRMTQGTEEDIIAALEEMIEALKKAQEELEQKQQQGPPQQGEPQDPPLVDVLAELKMVRALQMRVNRRTDRYSNLVEGEQATSEDLIEALKRLADRQERIFQITRDLHKERNQ